MSRKFKLEIRCGANWPPAERLRLIGILTEATNEALEVIPGMPLAMIEDLQTRIRMLATADASTLENYRAVIAEGGNATLGRMPVTNHLHLWDEECSADELSSPAGLPEYGPEVDHAAQS